MPFPNLNAAFETFLEPTRIFLFGKEFPSLKYDPASMNGAANTAAGVAAQEEYEDVKAPAEGADLPMPPGPVEWALRQVQGDGIFARIYGFSFEGHYYKLQRPVLFLVRRSRSRNPEDVAGGVRSFDTRFTGVEGKDWQFSNDLQVWAVDRYDMAVCLDVEIGSYDDVLLQSSADESGFRGRASARDAAEFRGRASARDAADFRGRVSGPHQAR